MFNFNDASILDNAGSSIFNGGNTGKVNNVEISMERKAASDTSQQPDVKFFFTDAIGSINLGWYYGTSNPSFDQKANDRIQSGNVMKLYEIALAVVPAGFVFPNVDGMNYRQVEDTLLAVIEPHIAGKRVNVYTTYGTIKKAKPFLQTRAYLFVEPATTPAEASKLVAKPTDQMTRIEPTAPTAPSDDSATDDFFA